MSESTPPQPDVPSPPEDNDDGIDLRAYVEILRKRAWLVGVVVAIGVTATVLYTRQQQQVYQATASVVIDPKPPTVFGNQVQEVIQFGSGGYWLNREYLNTQVDLLQTYDLIRATVDANDLHEDPRVRATLPDSAQTREQRVDAAASALTGRVIASQNEDNRIVRVHVRHPNQGLAVEVANRHLETYIAHTLRYRAKGSTKVAKFLATELDGGETRLRESEERLYEFKRQNDILSVSLEDKQNILARDIGRFTNALSDTRIKRIELSSVRDYAKNLKDEDVIESPIFALASNSEGVNALKHRYVQERERLAEIAKEIGPKHPDYERQKSKVDELFTTVKQEARRAMLEIEAKYKTALKAERQFEAEVVRLKQEAFELGPKTVEYNRLKRQQQSDEENYNMVLGRLRASELSGRNTEIHIRPHQSARHAALVYPRMRTNVVKALLLALVLGLGLVFALEHFDRTLKSAEDIERTVHAPLLGIIPVIKATSNRDVQEATRERDLFVFENTKAPATECCRSIRTNILFSSPDRPLKSMVISSPQPREGKTTTAIYLGTIMAQSGKPVLLVDSDLRKPRLHRSVGVSRNVGLTNLIMGDAEIEDAIKTTDVPNLYVLPCGPLPPNPAELLLTNRFKEILHQLEERFSFVLLDSPPLLAVTDAVVLARKSDGVLMVAQAGKTSIDDARQSARLLRDVNARILGVVLNDLDLSDRRYYYYYAYNYGYGEEAAATEGEAP